MRASPCSCAFLSSQQSPPPYTYTLSLHDALPISRRILSARRDGRQGQREARAPQNGGRQYRPERAHQIQLHREERRDRKSTRLNSSHRTISYAVFCLKKKTIHTSPST